MKSINYISAQEAVKVVQSNDKIYIQAGGATPTLLTDVLTERASELKNVELSHIFTLGNMAHTQREFSESFFTNSFFISTNVRQTLKNGNGTFTPVFLNELPDLFYQKYIKIDGVFIQVSPPDENGYCSLGVSVEACLAAMENARYVIAVVNEMMPRTYGDALIHQDKITHWVKHNSPIHSIEDEEEISEIENKIAEHIAPLIEDGATLQAGIGSLPNAVLKKLTHLKNLGVHTELLTDGVIELAQKGIITGSEKKIDTHKIVCTFAFGSKKMYDFMNNNPDIEVKKCDYTNNPFIIAQNPKMISINSAIEVDVTGQVCADSIGTRMFSGVGGQVDFVRGASLSKGGKSIIAITSTTKKGESRIVPFLKQGAGVVTSRYDVRYIATEYGIVNLQGKNLLQRQKALIEIAHPNHQEDIERKFFELWKKDNF